MHKDENRKDEIDGSVAMFRYRDIELELHAEKCAWHPASRSLFVADLHLGKETSFQRASLPIPLGSTQQALDRLSRLVAHYQPQRLVILGDMVHASSSFAPSFRERMNEFWKQQTSSSSKCQWILVEGNHDLRAKRELSQWPITIVPPPWSISDLVCIHDPESIIADTSINSRANSGSTSSSTDTYPRIGSIPEQLILAGHIHPNYRMPDNGEKLSCFAHRHNLLIFPAFNEFTGRRAINDSQFDSVYVIRHSHLARIDL